MFTNWQTSLPGFLALATALWNAYQTKTVNWIDIQAALVGIGLMRAKDWNVTGGSREQ